MKTRACKLLLREGMIIALMALAVSVRADSITLEAESGALGSDFTNSTQSGVAFISISTDGAGNNPGSAARVATYSVTFPSAGTYDLYARVRVGPATYSDDSMFYANGFGSKTATVNGDWILVNGLAPVGYTASTDVVSSAGTAASGLWKWINLSMFAPGPAFTVSAGNLTQTFQIGARENGLDLDKFVFGTTGNSFTVNDLDNAAGGTSPPPPPSLTPGDMVNGNLIQFNDNGAWTWYSDERAIIDHAGGKLVVGVDVSGTGLGGSSRDGAIEAGIFDLQGGTSQRTTLMAGGTLGPDDHNGPAFMLRPDGKYLAQWTGHNANFLSYFRVFDANTLGSQTTFDWATVGAVSGEQASYSNPHYLPAEGRAYTFVRAMDNRSPQILVSTNYGDTWSYYGKLVRPSTNFNVGYNPGYFRYCDNGSNRIDFICTEAHPRDYLTSIYHGYISNGMSFKTDGTVVDSDLTNTNNSNVPFSYSFTPVFTNGTIMPPGQTNYRCWNDDVQLYPDGTIECIISARINQSYSAGYPDTGVNPDHAFFFCRYDGTKWTPTYLCQAGYKMYSSEGDYVGLGCLSPNDPNTIYISTQYDPRAVQPGVTDTNSQYSTAHEIWKGVTTDHGASFTWTPITQNSLRDNFRPIVPAWDGSDTALIWFRGPYSTAQIYDEAPVGIVEHRSEVVGQMHYVDATAGAGGNTTLTNGTTLTLSGSANQWHSQTGVGNGGTVLSSADATGEDAPRLMTQVPARASGTYDVWVDFWGNPAADWRINAGLAPDNMQTYRSEKCEQVQPATQDASLVLTNSTPAVNYLYQAYVGRVVLSNDLAIKVLIDDNSIATGGDGSTHVGDTARTWYDGISYARVSPFQIQNVYATGPASIALVWNSPLPQSSLTTPSYTVQKKNSLTDPSWTTVAAGIPSGGYTTTNMDTSANGSAAFYRVIWP
jgi:hypothetical protein